MVKVKIADVVIEFPYPPYKAQIVTISKMIGAFKSNQSALIESPTGTGKSLAILCATSAYLEYIKLKKSENTNSISIESQSNGDLVMLKSNEIKNFIDSKKRLKKQESKGLNKIFICSRTHKQLDQLIEQLRMTKYRPKITILGSREQYCISAKVRRQKDLETGCSKLIKSGGCNYYKGKDKLGEKMEGKLFDIEEMRKTGISCLGCPYYASKDLVENAEIVFAPYNYLLNPQIRGSMGLSLANSIVIIDEAHNVEDSCRSAGSLEMSSKILDITFNDIIHVRSAAVVLANIKVDIEEVFKFVSKIRDNAKNIECSLKDTNGNFYVILKGKEMMKQFDKMELSNENWIKFKGAIGRLKTDKDANDIFNVHTLRFLEQIEATFTSIFNEEFYDYAFLFKKKSKSSNDESENIEEYSYNFCLLNPGPIFKEIAEKASSVILLSGTLTPFEHVSHELQTNFMYEAMAPHILKSSQVFVSSLSKSINGTGLCGTYKISETPEYKAEIVNIIKSVGESVKEQGGVLVFVPSYGFLNKILALIKKDRQLLNSIVIEPQTGGNKAFEYELKKYKSMLSNKNTPSIMLCVYRGKGSEGIDFKDHYARAVICVGIPFPAIKDPLINLKMDWNDKQFGNDLSGRVWYSAQAFKALKQAIGRTIRHEKDWGVLYLVDSRFTQSNTLRELPGWVQNNIKSFSTFKESENEMLEFVKCKHSTS